MMSNLGKIIVIGAVGVVCYYSFIKKENPLAGKFDNPVEKANKDYVEHKTEKVKQFAEKNATILQDSGAERAITANQ